MMNIVWFRRDLRLSDNESFFKAVAGNAPVIPCFIIDPWFYKWKDIGKARVRFLFESLEDLHKSLQKRNSKLYIFTGNSVEILQRLTYELIEQDYQPKLYFNHDVQVEYGLHRDKLILDFYRKQQLQCYLGLNNFLQVQENREQWFNEYYTYQREEIYPTPTYINTPNLALNIPQLSLEELKQKYRTFWEVEKVYFPGGEIEAAKVLTSFLKSRFKGYHWKISHPWMAQRRATSHLSPHLTFGTISTRTVYQQTKKRAEELQQQPKAGFSLKAFRDRLRWHDSFTQRLYSHPEIAYKNRFAEFDEYYQPGELTAKQQEIFQAWCQGMTGFPMVDASMRQLLRMGWMNFRMRAMCATFLTINCGVSWHHGAKHYMNYLVDGDLAINNWQWQMQAGITNPLSDTFRIYNPNKNIKDKDPELNFIYHWVEELRSYSLPEILDEKYISQSQYPEPIINWSETRKINGKIVSNLRKQVKKRLISEKGEEYYNANATKVAVDKYRESRDKQYQKFRTNNLE